jgi:hypothetical protein
MLQWLGALLYRWSKRMWRRLLIGTRIGFEAEQLQFNRRSIFIVICRYSFAIVRPSIVVVVIVKRRSTARCTSGS